MPRSRPGASAGSWALRSLGAVLLVDIAWLTSAPIDAPASDSFQAAVAGLGGGHAVGVNWSFFAFDPRLEGACENEWSPIPGLHCPNPHHGVGVVDRPALDGLR